MDTRHKYCVHANQSQMCCASWLPDLKYYLSCIPNINIMDMGLKNIYHVNYE